MTLKKTIRSRVGNSAFVSAIDGAWLVGVTKCTNGKHGRTERVPKSEPEFRDYENEQYKGYPHSHNE